MLIGGDYMQSTGKTKNGLNPLLYGYLHSLGSSILLTIIVGFIFHFSSLSEAHIKTFSAVIILISVFWGGFKAAYNCDSRGLFYGLGVGLFFLLSTIFITFLVTEPINFKDVFNRFIICMLGGALGGVIGVFLK
jgi:putative membrane protein (TIGR04086 family)